MLLQFSTTWGASVNSSRERWMVRCSRVRVPRVHEDFPILVGRLIYTPGERFGDLAQLNGTLCGIILKCRGEVDVSGALGVLLDSERSGLLP